MYTPSELLTDFPQYVLTIDSTEDTRKLECRYNALKFKHINPDTIAIRHEPDTQYLFVDAAWLDQDKAEDLFQNTQYKGRTSMRLLKGTGLPANSVSVHVFDLRATSALRSTNRVKRDNYRRKLMRDLKGDIPAVAAKLAEYDELNKKLGAASTEESLLALKREIKTMLNTIKRVAEGKPERRVLKKLGRMERVDNYIMELKNFNRLSRQGVAIKRENNVPHLRSIDFLAGPDAQGVFKESINLNGTNHKRRVYIEAARIKKIIPNYRRDTRYITSHTTYIKHLDADGNPTTTNLYCAVFDLLK